MFDIDTMGWPMRAATTRTTTHIRHTHNPSSGMTPKGAHVHTTLMTVATTVGAGLVAAAAAAETTPLFLLSFYFLHLTI